MHYIKTSKFIYNLKLFKSPDKRMDKKENVWRFSVICTSSYTMHGWNSIWWWIPKFFNPFKRGYVMLQGKKLSFLEMSWHMRLENFSCATFKKLFIKQWTGGITASTIYSILKNLNKKWDMLSAILYKAEKLPLQ